MKLSMEKKIKDLENRLVVACGEPRRCRDSKKGLCLMAEKPEGRFLTKKGSSPERYKVQAEGGPLDRIKACLNGAC